MNVVTRPVLPISGDDFVKMFRKCRPPNGWSRTIAVANSGGPDSTCLLFLINRYLKGEQPSAQDQPHRLVSLTIDHGLQASSSAMAKHCTMVARSLGVEHFTSRVPWSEPPFPKRPSECDMFEGTARLARYHLLFQAMRSTGANILAFGHHADDQVETSLMRLARGTTEVGAGGMRRCRRWGMGMGTAEGSLGWAGHEGMNKWVIRPLLDVIKDRIFATCEKNGLEYITDETNFQPHLTLRNAIRQILATPENDYQEGSENVKSMPLDIAEKLKVMKEAVSTLQAVSVDVSNGIDQLRGAVKTLTSQVEDMDSQVDSHLKRCTLPSPPGTYLISTRGLSAVHNDMVRVGMILRIMRYVSFHPWGSIRADGNRRRRSTQQIVDKIWNPEPFSSGIRMFVAGGGVLWTPVLIRGESIKMSGRVAEFEIRQGETAGWLASRQPPLHRDKMEKRGMVNPLQLDVTELLTATVTDNKKGASTEVLEVLYDCRFLLRFNLSRIPGEIATAIMRPQAEGQILIQPNSRWYWPKVVWRRGREIDVLHSAIVDKTERPVWSGPGKTKEKCYDGRYWKRLDRVVSAEWIDIEWIRSLNAI